MAGELYVDLAVKALFDVIDANLDTQLRAVETAQGLAANVLKSPSAIVSDFTPMAEKGGDGNPFVMVYEIDFDVQQQRTDLFQVRCAVSFIWTQAATGFGLFGRRWLTAVHQVIKNNSIPIEDIAGMRTLRGQSEDAEFDSESRHLRTLEVMVTVKH